HLHLDVAGNQRLVAEHGPHGRRAESIAEDVRIEDGRGHLSVCQEVARRWQGGGSREYETAGRHRPTGSCCASTGRHAALCCGNDSLDKVQIRDRPNQFFNWTAREWSRTLRHTSGEWPKFVALAVRPARLRTMAR